VLAAVLLLSACGGPEQNKGGMPVGVDDGGSTSPSGTPTATKSATTAVPTAPPKSAKPRRRAAQVTVVPGNFASNPAVQGLVKNYPVYFSALVARDANLVKNSFPAFFYADTSLGINEAKANGWVMKPPGSVVVVGIQQQPYGVIRVKTCRSQTTQYWDPKAKAWTLVAPMGSPQAFDMIETGLGWTMYRVAPPRRINCSRVRYPA